MAEGLGFTTVVCGTSVTPCVSSVPVTPWFSSAKNLRVTSGSVEVFGASATTKDEFRSSSVTFLGFSALVAACVSLLGVRRTCFWVFRSLAVRASAEWDVLLMKRLLEVAF